VQHEQQVNQRKISAIHSHAGQYFSPVGLMIARVVWVVFTLGILVLSASSLSGMYTHLQIPCQDPNCDVGGQITVGNVVALHRLGLPIPLYALYPFVLSLLVSGILLLVSCVIFWRRSNQWFPYFVSLWLLVGTPVGHNSSLLSPQVMSVINNGFVIVLFSGLGVFWITFPNGRFAPRWSWLIPLLWILQLMLFMAPSAWPLWIGNWPAPLFALEVVTVYGSTLVLQVYRYRHVYTRVERQQTKWLVYGLAITVLYLLCNRVLVAVLSPDSPVLLVLLPVPLVLALCLGLSVGAAVLRYQLWDIDLIINRTLVYGGLSACVIGLYMLLVGYFGALFRIPNNPVISLIATALVAIAFQPLRGLLQRAVNRLMYGERDAPYQVLARLDQQLAPALPPEEVLPALVKTIATTLKLPYVAVALIQSDAPPLPEERLVATCGHPTPHAQMWRLPLVYQGETVGQFVLAPRPGEVQLTHADRQLLEDLARHAGVIAHAVRLTNDLRRSRERIVVAREEERRRLRRDLHDGLGPLLASLTLTLAAAREYLRHDPTTTDTLLQELATQAQGAVADIRRLVYELRPPALDDLGLVGALRDQAARSTQGGLQVDIEAPQTVDPLPAAVEVAAYRISVEALTNVVRHAQASNCTIQVRREADLVIEISDDGRGLPAEIPRGIGLRSMRERAEELGGRCVIAARPEGGTQVAVHLPLAEEGEGSNGAGD
jgi:signal transduction histidine kinase